MSPLAFPPSHVGLLHELGARLIDGRKPGADLEVLARALLGGFYDIATRSGLDGLLAELAEANPPLDAADRATLTNHPTLVPALVERLHAIKLDGGGPRNARPGQLADCVVGALGLTLAAEPDRTITLDDSVRAEVAAAIASVLDVELAVPALRDAIIADGRDRCELRYKPAFDKLAAQLDERGMKVLKQPNLPLDAVQAVQRYLFEARASVLDRAARRAIDRAQAVIARADADAAARIDQPITLRLTPRQVAIARAADPSVPRTPSAVAASLLASLGELARIAWRAAVRIGRPYSPKETFAVGDLIEHPKFGRGSVISAKLAKIEVEFPDAKVTLIHVPGK